MALSATIALSSSTISFNQQDTASVTISNSGGSSVTLVSLAPQIIGSSAPQFEMNSESQASDLPKGFGQQFTVPASGSVIVPFNFLIFPPQVQGAPGNVPETYLVGCNCITSDGSSFSPSPATVTVLPLSLPVSEQ